MFPLVELASLLVLTLGARDALAAAPSVRGASIVRRAQETDLNAVAFVPLSCNREVVPCQSFVKTFGADSIKADLVTIPCGQCFTMDHAEPTITFRQGLDIQGKLVFPDSYRIRVVSPLIVVQGELVIVSQKQVDGEEQVVFTLTGED
jgi:hypothetical protein